MAFLGRCVVWLVVAWSISAAIGPGIGAAIAKQLSGQEAPVTQDSSANTMADAVNLVGHGGPVHAVAVSNDGRRALTGSFDGSAIVWDLTATPPAVRHRLSSAEFAGPIKAVAFSPNAELSAVAGGDGRIWIYRTGDGEQVHTLEGHQSEITALAYFTDGRRIASTSTDRSARIWNLDGGKTVVVQGHTGPVTALALSADESRIFTASYDGTVRTWDTATGSAIGIVHRHGLGVNVMARVEDPTSPDATLLAFGALDGAAGILDAGTGRLVHEFRSFDGPILSVATISRPGLIALGGACCKARGGAIRILRAGDWQELESFDEPYRPVWALAFQPGGTELYYGTPSDIVVSWQISPRKAFEPAQGEFPLRFQVSEGASPGELQFARKCSLCHSLTPQGRNRNGPTLYRVFGRRAGTLPGYPYSSALRGLDLVWTAETIEKLFSEGPDRYTPGSKMPLQRITDPASRKALVEFLARATQ